MIENFHFLRPLWLFALLAAAGLAWAVSRQDDARHRWQKAIAPHLLENLVLGRSNSRRLRPVHLTIALIALGAIAAAGPTWQREPSPLVEDTAPLAIAIDLSVTMDATDIAPTRLERVKLKVKDLLAQRAGGRAAVFAYAGSAHMVLPLTDDAQLLQTYVDSLATRIMPLGGKDTAQALRVIQAALADEATPGTILFMTDGVESGADSALAQQAGPHQIVVLGVGTAQGGQVKSASGDYLANASGDRVFARLDIDALHHLKSAGVAVSTITSDDADVQWIIRQAQTHLEQSRNADSHWQDAGWWLVFPIAFFSVLWFRRGWTIRWTAALLAASALLAPPPTLAAPWRLADAWLSHDQQGRLAFERGDFAGAADVFEQALWKGVAQYRAAQYEAAADTFSQLDTAPAYYNQGNALAQLGRLAPAVASYQEALKRAPGWPEAQHNLELLQALIAKEQKAQQEQGEEPNEQPDSVQFDDKGKMGKRGQVSIAQQTADMWMRNIQTTPTDLLARRFSIEAAKARP